MFVQLNLATSCIHRQLALDAYPRPRRLMASIAATLMMNATLKPSRVTSPALCPIAIPTSSATPVRAAPTPIAIHPEVEDGSSSGERALFVMMTALPHSQRALSLLLFGQKAYCQRRRDVVTFATSLRVCFRIMHMLHWCLDFRHFEHDE
jgi:hypothetical protein